MFKSNHNSITVIGDVFVQTSTLTFNTFNKHMFLIVLHIFCWFTVYVYLWTLQIIWGLFSLEM